MAKASEHFTRITDTRMRELLEKISLERNLPFELLFFNMEEAADILKISKRSLDTLKAERRISFSQNKPRGKVTFSAHDLVEFKESTKLARI